VYGRCAFERENAKRFFQTRLPFSCYVESFFLHPFKSAAPSDLENVICRGSGLDGLSHPLVYEKNFVHANTAFVPGVVTFGTTHGDEHSSHRPGASAEQQGREFRR
jgi:hypothetical protein